MNFNLRYKLVFLTLIIFSITKSQVVADFTADNYDGCSPLTVNFTDQSTSAGTITSWSWDFGNGNVSALQNPGSVYLTPGVYPVCLTVSDGTTSNTFCDTVTVYNDPIVNFIADDSVGCANLDVNFTNLTITGTGIETAQWNFGDGNSSFDINPSHTFLPGVFTITLIITDSSGCIGQGDKIQYIYSSMPPTANFSGTNTQSCAIPNAVNFTNTSTFDAGATYTWDFGDASPVSNLENPNHSYLAAGSYDVSLIVDKAGCIDTIVQSDFVVLSAQDADFTVNNTNICEGETVNFTDLSVLTATSWSWDFGDGSALGTSQNPSHTYTTAGTYTVSMTAFLSGCDDTETKNNFITVNTSPTGSFIANKHDTCSVPFTVDFTSTASAGSTYSWNFGDGNTSTLQHPTHTYTSFGNFNVSLTVTSVNNCSSVIDSASFININAPVANFNIDSAFGCAPKIVSLTDLSTSSNTITDWLWDFGDGTPIQNGPNNPTHIYTDTGTFNISLVIIDNLGCTDTLIPGLPVQVGQAFATDFSVIPILACRVEEIIFTNLTDTLGIDGVQWHWDFGDGGQSFAYEPIYQYGDTGYFNVSLSAIHNGCASDTTMDSIVRILGPIALFDVVFDCVNNLTATFNDNSIAPETWHWEIDGNIFNTQNVTYTFPDTGTYDIFLEVENITNGCIDSIEQTITMVEPIPNFTYDDSLGCPPFTVNFTDLSQDALSWHWDFGDGNTSSSQNPIHTYTVAGIYDVFLVITSLNDCQDTLLKIQKMNVLSSIPDFTANDTSGCSPFSVNFTDLSTTTGGAITNWNWDFGDGNTSIIQNPSHTYSSVGSFNVSLQIIDNSGCVGTFTRPTYITSTGPLPSFNNNAITCKNDTIFFNNTSSSLGGTVTNWTWNFGDGTGSTLENPYHIYTNFGNYDVSLTILDDNGCNSTLVVNNSVFIDSMFVDFEADSTVGNCTGFIVNFNELVTPNPTSWTWDFGNGSGSAVSNPSVVFNTVGTFDVTLIATNASGCIDTLVKPDFITINGPVGVLSNTPNSGCINLDVDFTIISGNSIGQVWDFGDGTVVTNNLLTFTHTYSTIGTFYPLVILEDAFGCQIPYYFDSIQVGSLNAELYIDTNYICNPTIVNFIDSSNSTSSIINWAWSFGDGNVSSMQNPNHTYSTNGVYDVQLIVTNAYCSDTITDSVIVNEPFAVLNSSPDSGCINLQASFDITSTNSSEQIWFFGEGMEVTNNLFSMNYTYSNTGTFYPQVIIRDANCLDTLFFDSVEVGSLNANLYIDTNYICTPDIVNFADSSNSIPAVNNWLWSFGDGNTSSSQNPSHNYTSGGVFDIELIVNNGLCSDTVSALQYIVSDSSTFANFNIIPPAIVCPPTIIQFIELSSADSAIISWQWDFGNEITDNTQNPISISYDTSGVYVVSLEITTNRGCTNIFEDTLIVNQIPVFSFNLDTIELCLNQDTVLDSLANANFTWTPANQLSCSDCPNPTITGNHNETYFVHAITSFGCEYDDTLELVVHNLPPITVSEDQKVNMGTSIIMNAFSNGFTNFVWSPSENLSCNNCADNTFIANETTEFIIAVIDDFGCVNQDTILIEVFDLCDGSSIFLPNVFTPNNDGQNDVFKATTMQNLDTEIKHFRIFDRWGKMIFETTNIDEAWTGYNSKGNYMNNGVYVYVLDVICSDGSDLQLKGNVTLLR